MVKCGLHYMGVREKWVWLSVVYTIWEFEKSGYG